MRNSAKTRPIDIYLTEPQEEFIFSNAVHPGMVAGYGAGKSQAGAYRILLNGALRYNNLSFGFVEPTYDLVRLIAFDRFEQILNDWQVPYKLNKSAAELTIEPTRSKIIFRSADNPNRMVGFEVADSLIDEIDTLKQAHAQDVWIKMIARTRQKKPDGTRNTVSCVSTPEGFRWMYENYGKVKKPGYELIKAPTSSNPYLPEYYIETLRNTYPSQLLDAYLEGEFVNMTSGSVYYDFDRALNGSTELVQSGEQLHIGMDFNVGKMCAVVWVMRQSKTDYQVYPHAVMEYTGVFDTPAMIKLLQERYPNQQITVYPDASGDSRKTNNASTSDIMLLRKTGFGVSVNSVNPFVRDRVLAVNAKIFSNGVRGMFVNQTTCPEFTRSLEQQAYDNNGEPDKSAGLDHIVDAGGYFIANAFPVRNRIEGKKIWVR